MIATGQGKGQVFIVADIVLTQFALLRRAYGGNVINL
jgi:hypothetical protein